jgi:hypothetical protein
MFSKPQKTEAVWGVADINFQGLDFQEIVWKILEQVLKYIAKKLADKIAQSTVNWINGGFKGKPAFIDHPDTFFRDILKTEIKAFSNEIGLDSLKYPFGKDFVSNLTNEVKSTFLDDARSTLSTLDLTPGQIEYRRDNFSAGGFNDLLFNTQLPQNNFLGFSQIAKNEVHKRLTGPAAPLTKVKEVLNKGAGFLNQEKCASNPNWSPDKLKEGLPLDAVPKFTPPKFDPLNPKASTDYTASWEKAKADAPANFQKQYGCPEGPKTVTPGSVVSSEIQKALGGKKDSLNLAANLGNIVGVVLDALVAKFERDGLAGLNKLLTPKPPKAPEEFNYKKDGANYTEPNYNYNPDAGSCSDGISSTELNCINSDTNGDGIPDGKWTPDPSASSPVSVATQLIANVNIVNDDGGTLQIGDVQVFIDDLKTDSFGPKLLTGTATQHKVSTNNPPGYTVTFGGNCDSFGYVTTVVFEKSSSQPQFVCDITLNDIANPNPTGRLTINAYVINDNGGTLLEKDMVLLVDGVQKVNGIQNSYDVGTYTVSADSVTGYTITIGGDCTTAGSVTLAVDDIKECAVTADDN